jgi:hemerythrin-like metal-binding protein
MQPLEWTADDCVYFPQLDTDHQKILEDAESLRRSFALGRSTSRIGCLRQLSKSISDHFAGEEGLMRTSRFPGFQWHQSQHDAGRKKLALLTQAVHNNDELGVREGLEDLARWLTNHVHLADRMFAAHLRNDLRERLAS